MEKLWNGSTPTECNCPVKFASAPLLFSKAPCIVFTNASFTVITNNIITFGNLKMELIYFMEIMLKEKQIL